MKIKGEIILPHIYTITYPTQYELCMSFVRIQEFYESPKFRGKYFTLEQYMDYWCANQGKGSFTYPSVWNGFNVPGDVLKDWWLKCEEAGEALREREIKVLGIVEELMWKEGLFIKNSSDLYKIYVIGIHEESSDKQGTIDHESSHAFYRFYPKYKSTCDKIIKKLSRNEIKKMSDYLISVGYNKKVLKDEIQAYSSTGTSTFVTNAIVDKKVKEQFKNNFKAFRNNLVKEQELSKVKRDSFALTKVVDPEHLVGKHIVNLIQQDLVKK